MDKEYLMLRSEIDESLKKQDQVFAIIISILGLSNVFSHVSESILYLYLILFLSTLLQLKILEYRNIVYYISTYLIVFLEVDTEFRWETRLGEFKEEGYSYESHGLKKKAINTLVIGFGRIIKHFMILGLVAFIVFRIMINVYKSYYLLWIKIVLYVVASLLVIFNILYAYTLSTDKINYKSYLSRWKKIREQEIQVIISNKRGKNLKKG